MKDLILNILRYIVTIPLALIGAVLGSLLLPYAFVFYFPVGSMAYDFTWFATSNVCFVLIPLIVLYNCPPKKHTKIIVTLGLLYSIMWVLAIILSIVLRNFYWSDLGKAIIQIITIISYLLSLPDESKSEITSENI